MPNHYDQFNIDELFTACKQYIDDYVILKEINQPIVRQNGFPVDQPGYIITVAQQYTIQLSTEKIGNDHKYPYHKCIPLFKDLLWAMHCELEKVDSYGDYRDVIRNSFKKNETVLLFLYIYK